MFVATGCGRIVLRHGRDRHGMRRTWHRRRGGKQVAADGVILFSSHQLWMFAKGERPKWGAVDLGGAIVRVSAATADRGFVIAVMREGPPPLS